MGKGVAKVLAGIDNQIHEVILLCRSKERGESTIKEIGSFIHYKGQWCSYIDYHKGNWGLTQRKIVKGNWGQIFILDK